MSIHEDVRERQLRAARHQALFREVNERVWAITRDFQSYTSLTDWVCECAVGSCSEPIEMATEDYEHIRGAGKRFFVAPSDEHVWTDVERVVEKLPKYWIVEKVELGAKSRSTQTPREGGLCNRTSSDQGRNRGCSEKGMSVRHEALDSQGSERTAHEH